ncbi:MAG: acetyl-CoA carboxylase biotin carboxyl carrier protein [Actinomycetota bacterium]
MRRRPKRVKITDTTLRDAHQSLWATRMRTEDMVPILGKMDKVGYHSMEVWGGATFDAPLRFLDESPWDRLRTIKSHVRNTPLQMLLRGQNLVGYKHYPDDIVRRFVHHAAKNGIDIFRIFDALNDTRNFKTAVEAVKEIGAHFQASVCYTISPIHTLEHYVNTALELVEMGADSICIKDMAALLTPYRTHKLVQRLRKKIDLPIQLHCHYIGGMAPMNYIKAIEAGVDIIDTATVPLAFGNSQPAVEMVVAALKDTPYDSGIDLDILYEIAEYWESVRERRGFKRGVTSLTHMKVFSHQVPGGMISNLYSQLEEQNALDRLPEVLEEIPRVRAEVGYPPLVTPLSQIVGIQAVINVLSGKRWSVIPDEMRDYVKGLYGRPPGPMDPEIERKILGDEKRIDVRPAELLTETFEDYAKEVGDLAQSEEDVLTFALFPKPAREYLENRARRSMEKTVFLTSREISAVKEDGYMNVEQIRELVKIIEQSGVSEIVVEEGGVRICVRKGTTGVAPSVEVSEGEQATEAEPQVEAKKYPDHWKEITAPMVGTFYRAPAPDAPPFVEINDVVEQGQTICILEAMKLMNEITAEEKGIIKEILVENGHPVEYGQVLFLYEPTE